MLDNIRIVLINTSHPGNIGSCARAMKTMGIKQLYLVTPKQFPHPKAIELASNASEVLSDAIVCATLDEAIGDCQLVIGTSARWRNIPWPLLTPKEMALKVAREAKTAQCAILLGNEQNGLTNEELHRCHFHTHIPSNPEYSSLNIAAALQIMTYELRMQYLEYNRDILPNDAPSRIQKSEPDDYWDYRFATDQEMEGLYEHLEKTLVHLEFLNPEYPRQLMVRLRRLFTRARPDMMEVNLLRGMLKAIDKK